VRSGAIPETVRLDWLVALGLALLALAALALPVIGLAGPLQRARGPDYVREALTLWESSLAPTLWYGIGGAIAATICGLPLAAIAARSRRRAVWLAICLVALAIPSSLRALGWIAAGAQFGFLREVLGTEAGAAAAIGLQWLPLAVLLLAPALATLPESWRDRGLLAGVPHLTWLRRVLLPVLTPWLVVTIAATALLVLADVTSLMLLQPPGRTAFTSHVFAVMDNSTEVVVASLCVALVIVPLAAGMVLLASLSVARRIRKRFTPAA
jgi:ABC-type Fe3+ transport system permease subunit